MDAVATWLLEMVQSQNSVLALAVIAGAAAIEYVVPPFPGDTVTLAAAILVTAYGWSFVLIFGAIMLGSVAGSMAAFALGRHLERRRRDSPAAGHDRQRTLDAIIARFRRHGAAYLILNRFVPGIRSLFFVAAGIAGMSPRAVLAYTALSAALWNLLLMAVGAALGANVDELLELVRRYTVAAWLLLAIVAAAFVGRWLWRRHR